VTAEDADSLIAQIDEPGASELAGLLRELAENDEIQHIRKIKAGVYRFTFVSNGAQCSLVAKRLPPDRAERNRLVAERWLPAAGLGRHGPALAGAVASPGARCVWHVYEDLGRHTLEDRTDPRHVRAATALLARLHSDFIGHPLLAECRLWGEDHGTAFYRTSVCDAMAALEALHAPGYEHDFERIRLRDRLLVRLDRLRAEAPSRTELLARAGGAETLLHGDLWPRNMFVLGRVDELLVRLIDWDHVGVGSVSYDLSIFLLRFPIEQRGQILDDYVDAGGRLPAIGDLNALCETAELARLANRVIWSALAARDDHAGWAFEELALVEQWFGAFDATILT
jgi:Phosphotransferase enzyme family